MLVYHNMPTCPLALGPNCLMRHDTAKIGLAYKHKSVVVRFSTNRSQLLHQWKHEVHIFMIFLITDKCWHPLSIIITNLSSSDKPSKSANYALHRLHEWLAFPELSITLNLSMDHILPPPFPTDTPNKWFLNITSALIITVTWASCSSFIIQ